MNAVNILRNRLITPTYTPFSTKTLGSVDVETVVVGAGVVGLAISRYLAKHCDQDVLVVDQRPSFGMETSSRNSEVVHAGLYYAVDSLKAALCVKGRDMLYDYCASHGVAFEKCGKLIVASEDEDVETLEKIGQIAELNGLVDLEPLTESQVHTMEPHVRCRAAFFSPSSGIVDSHGLMSSLERDIVSNGGTVAYNTMICGGEIGGSEKVLNMEDVQSGETTKVIAKNVVNSAGLWARKVSMGLKGISKEEIPRIAFVRGNYFSLKEGLARGPKFSKKYLVYPVPSNDGGLGIHATIDLSHSAIRFGPDVEWIDTIDDPDKLEYKVDPGRSVQFENALKRYCTHVEPGCLEPSYSGIRPKVVHDDGQKYPDFVIKDHGIPGLECLYGIESPGLTSCLALGEYVGQRLTAHDLKI